MQKIKSGEKISNPQQVEEDYYRLCPICGNFSHLNENHTYCFICGEKLIEECPGCNKKIVNPIGKFCPKCGESLILEKL
jgi:rRNA maturation endonuclease Nob1